MMFPFMAEPLPIHPFETFPRHDLFQGLTRRQFFETMAAELDLFAWSSQGSNAVKISSLGSMPDDDLYEIIPRIIPGTEIEIRNDEIGAIPPQKTKLILLFPNEKLTLFTFNLINGQNSLLQIAQELSDYSTLPAERAFAFTRGFFLTLVKHGVCLPTNNPFLG
jgi:hypothetical protein